MKHKNKSKEKSKNKIQKKKGKAIKAIVEFILDIEREKEKLNKNSENNDIEENEYWEEILQINEDIYSLNCIADSDTEKLSNKNLEILDLEEKRENEKNSN